MNSDFQEMALNGGFVEDLITIEGNELKYEDVQRTSTTLGHRREDIQCACGNPLACSYCCDQHGYICTVHKDSHMAHKLVTYSFNGSLGERLRDAKYSDASPPPTTPSHLVGLLPVTTGGNIRSIAQVGAGRPTKDVSAARRQEVIRMLNEGMTQRDIAEKLQVHQTSVGRILKGQKVQEKY